MRNRNPAGSTEAVELYWYVLNTVDLGHIFDVQGYDPRSLSDWKSVALRGAKMYATEHASSGQWNEIFPPATREETARLLLARYVQDLNPVRGANPTPNLEHWAQASQREHIGPRGSKSKKPSPRLVQRRLKTHHQKMPGVWANPLVNVKVKSPAQRGKAAPSRRLVARRKITEKAPNGFYANPMQKSESNANAARYAELYGGSPDTIRAWKDHYIVRFHKPGEKLWTPIAVFKMKNVAVRFAKEHARMHPTYAVSIVDAE
jgi:hypothetical protein